MPAPGILLAPADPREATFGTLTYLLFGAALGASVLLGTLVLGLEPVGDAVGAGFRERILSGEAQVLYLYAFFVAAPLIALVIAALLGIRAAGTQHEIGKVAAATTLYGLPIVWVNLAIAMLLTTALLDWIGVTDDRFDVTLSLVIESAVFLILETAVVAVFAAWMAGIARDAFGVSASAVRRDVVITPDPEPAPPTGTAPPKAAAAPAPEPVLGPTAGAGRLSDHPVECPRCHTSFRVTGDRPLRIECPDCGKTGIIH